MFRRLFNPLISNSFFLFGARGVGKSTSITNLLRGMEYLEIDLLDPVQYEEASLRISDLTARILSHESKRHWIFVDEIQKVPRLLDVAQRLIDKHGYKFILTGSSARKLKRGGANLLAGRAYTYNLFPLISDELESSFDLNTHLAYGGLPRIWNIETHQERVVYLRSYVSTYLKEEVAEEQLVRKLEPFSRFLQVAAQSSGKIVNYSNIAKDVGVSDQSVKTYFQILEETLVGTLLPPYSTSIRKTQGKSPKFYFFDTGILRTLRRQIDQPLNDQNYAFGDYFEHFIIHEIKRLADYQGKDYQYYFLRTASDQEIDLIVDRPGLSTAVIEIKSSTDIRERDVQALIKLGKDIPSSELYCLSRDPNPKRFGPVMALPWRTGVKEIVGNVKPTT